MALADFSQIYRYEFKGGVAACCIELLAYVPVVWYGLGSEGLGTKGLSFQLPLYHVFSRLRKLHGIDCGWARNAYYAVSRLASQDGPKGCRV